MHMTSELVPRPSVERVPKRGEFGIVVQAGDDLPWIQDLDESARLVKALELAVTFADDGVESVPF